VNGSTLKEILMQKKHWWLATILSAALILVGTVVVQPVDGQQQGRGGKGGKGGKGKGGTLNTSDIVDRILAYDKNGDGKVTKDELPERMHYLLERGDTNKDGVLDKGEIDKLASTIAEDRRAGVATPGFGGGRFAGGADGGFKGKGPGAFEQRALNELNLTGKSKERADSILKAHQDNVRKIVDIARSDLLVKMKDVLSEQDYKSFKEALDRRPTPPGTASTTTSTPPSSADIERRLDQLVKEIESLRRELKR
jgi:hypothetical protein